MVKLPIIARLSSSEEDDGRAEYVYMEVQPRHARAIAGMARLCARARRTASLNRLSRMAADGPGMWPLEELPFMEAGERLRLEEDECIVLKAPLELDELKLAGLKLCCEELHVFASGGLYAMACDDYSRSIFESNLGAARAQIRRLANAAAGS